MTPVQFYKCLADDIRLKSILLIQHQQELCVCELIQALNESQPKVSRHLAQLRKHGLLSDRRQGQWVFYRINPSLNDWMKQVIITTLEHNTLYLDNNLKNLFTMGSRPERVDSCCPPSVR